jgi:hypothetical protein
MKGLQTLASFIRATFESGSEDDKSALEAFQADEPCAADLEARAKSIKEASPTTALRIAPSTRTFTYSADMDIGVHEA